MIKSQKLFIAIFIGFGLVFLLTLHLRPYPIHYIVKAIPIFSLAILVIRRIQGKMGMLMFCGFLFSGIGDIVLELGLKIGFIFGIGAFLIAHLFYTIVFLNQPKPRGVRLFLALGIVIYGFAIGYWLLPDLGKMLFPVVAYLCVITLMGVSASIGSRNHSLIILGAYLFIISDSIIAVSRFLQPIAYGSYWIMVTYYAGQFFIAIGAIKSFPQLKNAD